METDKFIKTLLPNLPIAHKANTFLEVVEAATIIFLAPSQTPPLQASV